MDKWYQNKQTNCMQCIDSFGKGCNRQTNSNTKQGEVNEYNLNIISLV